MRIRELLKQFAVFALVSVPLSGVSGCFYDETEVALILENQERRLAALEQSCAQMNTNIASLQIILNALQNNDYISSTASVVRDGKVVGYTLNFVQSGSVTIYHGNDGNDGKDGADGKNGKDGEDGANGKDGVNGTDGSMPIIGVRQDEDGNWYWTLNGEWLLDDQGRKVCAVGKDGKDGPDGENGKDGTNAQDGITPRLKIEENFWYISCDNGQTWTLIGPATGADGKDGFSGPDGKDGKDGKDGVDGKDGKDGVDGKDGTDGKDGKDGVDGKDGKDGVDGKDGKDGVDGKDGKDGQNGDSMFSSITEDNDNVYITLNDGTGLIIPKEKALSITFSENPVIIPANYDYVDVGYELNSSDNDVKVDAVTSGEVKAKIIPDSGDPLKGKIRIATTTGFDKDSETASRIVVLVTSKSCSTMRTLNLEMAQLKRISPDKVIIDYQAQEVNLVYNSNLFGCSVVIPSEASAWCKLDKVIQTANTQAGTDSTVVVSIEPNDGLVRQTTVTVESKFSGMSLSYVIVQEPAVTPISFESSAVKNCLVNAKDTNGKKLIDLNEDGEISYDEANSVKSFQTVANAFNTGVTKGSTVFGFNEFKYFTGITSLPAGSFNDWTALTSISMPNSIEKVGGTVGVDTTGVFQHCTNLRYFDDKDYWALDRVLYKVSDKLTPEREAYFEIPDGVKVIGLKAFYKSKVKTVGVPVSLREIRDLAFKYSQLESISFPLDGPDMETAKSYVDSVSETAFNYCFYIQSFSGATNNGKIRVTDDHLGLYYVSGKQYSYSTWEGKDKITFYYPHNVFLAYAFGSASESFVISENLNITKLGYGVFSRGKNLAEADTKSIALKRLGLPSTLVHIGPYAFCCQKDMDLYFHYDDPLDTALVKPPVISEGAAFDNINSTRHIRFMVPDAGSEAVNGHRESLFHSKLSSSVSVCFYKPEEWPFDKE